MKVVINLIISTLCVTLIFSMGYAQKINGAKKIIYETDMCLDVDDVGALAILHAMADMGEAEILAVCFNEEHPNGPGTIDAINTWYGHGDIPIGIYKGNLVNDWSSNSDYLNYIDNNFPNDIDKASADSAVAVYRQILSEQPDSSVTIISVGFLNNLNDLMLAEPELIEQKVVELVIMAGVNNDDFNTFMHNLVDVSQNVLENWPTPIVISQPGGSIYTGDNLSTAPNESPVRWSYYKWFDDSFQGRPSWDQVAVLYGVRGLSTYFDMITTGSGSLKNGYTYPMVAGWRSYLVTEISNSNFEQIIEDLMDMLPPGFPLVTITSPQNNESFDSGADITIEADASDTDGSVVKVEFFDDLNKIGEDTTDPYSMVLENAGDGIYHLTAVVTDNENKSSSSSSVKIIVGDINTILVGHWEFEEDVTDASDFNNDGTISGSADFVAGKIGSALDFNNNQDLVTIPATSDFSITNFTLAAWVKLPNPIPSGWRTIVEHNRWGDNWFGLWESNNGNMFHFRWGNDGNVTSDFTSTISADNWYHVAATFDADQRTAKLYLNGTLDKTIQNTGAPSEEMGKLVIGKNYDGEEAFKGIIDDLRIYNRVLSGSEIMDLVTVTSIKDNNALLDQHLPEDYTLSNYPNPFNPRTIINYELPTTIIVELSIYNLVGQKVATLVSKTQSAGKYSVEWNGSGQASGVYYYELRTNDYRDVKKMVLMK